MAAAEPVDWTLVDTDAVQQLNSDLRPDIATADIGIYFPSNLDKAFTDRFSLAGLLDEFRRAKAIFAFADVQLKLLWIKSGNIDPSFLEIRANDIESTTPGGQYVNMYEDSLRQRSGLSKEALLAFESIVEVQKNNARTVYLVVLQGVFMSFYEKLDERTWALRTITTGGLSFPGYSYRDMPRRLRGVITVTRSDPNRGVLAHELGHKLINVSHEYREIDPQHEVRAEGGLMLYGSGTDIASGEEGRWHKERLHLSPYLYRVTSTGQRIWNQDYLEGGHYYDPLYGDKIVRFEAARATNAE
ncbi:MAG TPA: hypothetical protein PKK10_00890 [Woeseiaceae bacterium]|nr:hypothetical protein [Woeseiaceae bacterium]